MHQELILHIGSHKTGTTTIQHAMAANAKALARQGVCYAWAGKQPNLHHFIGRSDPSDPSSLGMSVRDMAGLKGLFEEVPLSNKIIASSEMFSFFLEPEPVQTLACMLRSQFDAVKIIVYVRRQDRHAISHHQQGAKPDCRPARRLYGNAPTALPDNPDMVQYLDYNRRIGLWLDAFGKDNVDVRVFDRASLVDGDVWPDFIEAAGLSKAELRKPSDKNISWGLTQTKVARILKKAEYDDDFILKIVRSLPKDAPQCPARAVAEAFYEPYRASNAELAKRIGRTQPLFTEDFSSYSDVSNEKWTEESVSRMILSLASMCGDSAGSEKAPKPRDIGSGLRAYAAGIFMSKRRFTRTDIFVGAALVLIIHYIYLVVNY